MKEQTLLRRQRSRSFFTLVFAVALMAPMFMFAVSTPGRAEAAPVYEVSQYRQWIADARAMYPYPQSADKMYRTMLCESGGNPGAVSPGGTYQGLFQYAYATWRGNWNPYRGNSRFDARSEIFATAKAWSIGMQGQWSCYYITAGR